MWGVIGANINIYIYIFILKYPPWQLKASSPRKNWWFGRWISFWEKFTIQIAGSVRNYLPPEWPEPRGFLWPAFESRRNQSGSVGWEKQVSNQSTGFGCFLFHTILKNALLERTSKQSQTHHQESEKNEYIEFRLYIYIYIIRSYYYPINKKLCVARKTMHFRKTIHLCKNKLAKITTLSLSS